jgi:hypothetical protein
MITDALKSSSKDMFAQGLFIVVGAVVIYTLIRWWEKT